MGKIVVKKEEAIIQQMRGWVTYDLIEPETGVDIRTMRLGLVVLRPGEETRLHYHNCEEILYIIEGVGYFEIEGTEYVANAGDGVFVEPNARHISRNKSNESLRYVFVCSQPQYPWPASQTITVNT